MKANGYRSGVALVTVLVLTGVTTIVLGGVLGYVSSASRMTAYYEGKNICRLAAQSEIELAKEAINHQFEYSLNRSARIVGGDTMSLSTASSYDWFEAYSGTTTKKTIGKVVGSKDATLTLANVVTNNGCLVKVRIGRVEHTVGDQWATVTLVAEATKPSRGGPVAKVILEETIRFAQQRSQVFNNAYFVNNFGWFEGGSTTFVNGDIRSNGDMLLDNNVIVNGHIYAARNDDLGTSGVLGLIYGAGSNTIGNMHDLETYKKSSTSYGTSNRARPLESDPITGALNKGGYAAPGVANDQAKSARLHPNQEFSVEMPYIGDISSNESEYREWAQELHDADSNMATIKQGGQTLVSVYYDHVGPSGEQYFYDSNGNQVQAPDYGAIVLVGTESNPIEINGPVIIPNDVIIRGYVKGQGTIYSGRNIHIVGDIKYKNPPSWNNKSTSGSDNKNKDLLGLMAKGNIVLGNCTDSSWSSGISTAMSSQTYVPSYDCDTSDAAIGYPKKFNQGSGSTALNYLSVEKVGTSDFAECESAGLADFVPGGRNSSSGQFGKNRGETVKVKVGSHKETQRQFVKTGQKWVGSGFWGHYEDVGYYQDVEVDVDDFEYRPKTSYDRKYYESVCNNSVITANMQKHNNQYYAITQIDAVLYNNHAICGKVGACSFNGALVCRNEAIQYSGALYMNWDIRLYSGSSETVSNDKVGLAKSSDNPPQVIDWRELAEGVVTFD
ncbi:MAG: hypothetical protein J5727_08355 [Kiritimatiellae bacterium]|nr:hypothetical protein [Kiritimatiellia bacterium]